MRRHDRLGGVEAYKGGEFADGDIESRAALCRKRSRAVLQTE